jgi:hypothetical protein
MYLAYHLFINLTGVGECFVDSFMSVKPDNNVINEFCEYLVTNYIRENSTFLPNIWAIASSCRSFSSNACKSFLLEFNSNFYHHHPNLFKIIKVLKILQINTYIKIRTSDTKNTSKNKQNKSKKKTKSYKQHNIRIQLKSNNTV